MSELEKKSNDEDLISKTKLKKNALDIKKFGLELSQYPSSKLKDFPISDTTLTSILDYQKITTNLAKKRQLMYVGKCLRHEDEAEIRQYILEQFNHQIREKKKSESPSSAIIEKLLNGDGEDIEQLLEKYPLLERQILRQLLRNIAKSKVESKKHQAVSKLKNYLDQSL